MSGIFFGKRTLFAKQEMITFGYGHEEQGCLVFNILIAGTSIMKTMD